MSKDLRVISSASKTHPVTSLIEVRSENSRDVQLFHKSLLISGCAKSIENFLWVWQPVLWVRAYSPEYYLSLKQVTTLLEISAAFIFVIIFLFDNNLLYYFTLLLPHPSVQIIEHQKNKSLSLKQDFFAFLPSTIFNNRHWLYPLWSTRDTSGKVKGLAKSES